MAEIAVKVVPSASRAQIVGFREGVLKVRVTAPPEAGKANRALEELLAAALGLKQAAVAMLRRMLSSWPSRWLRCARCLVALIPAFTLPGCTAPPPCRVDPAAAENLRVNGICLIAMDGRVLAVHHRASQKYDLPGGRRRPPETAQCAAHRETWEETGLDVTVGPRVARFWSAALYRCELTGPLGAEPLAPASAFLEVSGAEWVDPTELEPSDWRFEDRSAAIRSAIGH